jgi:hypothetical protein
MLFHFVALPGIKWKMLFHFVALPGIKWKMLFHFVALPGIKWKTNSLLGLKGKNLNCSDIPPPPPPGF